MWRLLCLWLWGIKRYGFIAGGCIDDHLSRPGSFPKPSRSSSKRLVDLFSGLGLKIKHPNQLIGEREMRALFSLRKSAVRFKDDFS